VEAPDWDPTPSCGHGLHGFLNGCGIGSLADWNKSAKWLVVEIDSDSIVDLDGKVKFPRGEVVFCGTREEAIAKLEALAPETKHMPVIGATREVKNGGSAMAGYKGTASAGNTGTATAGYQGTATAGEEGQATVGYNGKASVGNFGRAMAGNYGTATAGDYGQATVGNGGTATVKDRGKAIAGDEGTAEAGYRGVASAEFRGTASAGNEGKATVGNRGVATAGAGGLIHIGWWDEKANRMRVTTGYIGEDGLLANTPYRCDSEGKLVPASQPPDKQIPPTP
jgi:hypothetical protein